MSFVARILLECLKISQHVIRAVNSRSLCQVSDPVMCLLSPFFKDPRLDAKSSSTAWRRQSLICASLALILINGCGRKLTTG